MTFCSAPWTTVQIKNTGEFSYCCVSRDPIGWHYNADSLVKGRQEILQGKIIQGCKTACFDIGNLFASHKDNMNTMWPIKNKITAELDPRQVEYIDLRIGNVCNYTCLMCGERDSHLWGKINKNPNPHVSWMREPTKFNKIMNFISDCVNLKSISLAGGEPFYNKKQLFTLLNNIPCTLDLKFITNVSLCDDEIIQKLNQYKTGRLHCSIDGVNSWNEIQRVKSNWKTVEKNILKFSQELHKDWIIRVVPTFTVINTLGLYDYLEWFNKKLQMVRRECLFNYTICTKPDYMTLYNLPMAMRENVVKKIRSKNYDSQKNMQSLCNAILKDIKPHKNTITKLIKYLDYAEDKLHVDIYNTIPSLIELKEKIET